ncbi:MAG: right-handed parallel beta-helix repeat-containing protein [Candidatus Neomarinimicrobiota bacterium]
MNFSHKRNFNYYSYVFLFWAYPALLFAESYFVAPDGSDSDPGSLDQPFKTLIPAIAACAAGDTIYLRGGVYEYDASVTIDKSGEAGSPIKIWAYQHEIPILDFEKAGTGSSARGITLSADYWHLCGLIIQYAGDNGIHVYGSHNVLEQVTTRYNQDSGTQLSNGASFNLISNCDSYLNYDPANHGENADGFAAKFDLAEGNVFRGCRAWSNSDDGWDFWEAGNGVTVEDCWAFRNGENIWNDPEFAGDANGFKLGHGSGAHILIRCLAFDHQKHGIDVNGNLSGVQVYNCTCNKNEGKNFYFDEHSDSHVLRNNLSFDGGETIYLEVDDEYNSWNGFLVTESDFISLDSTGVTGPRDENGGLPQLDFLHLAEGSSLIDAGVDVGSPFEGPAPDLGAFEFSSITEIVSHASQQPEQFAVLQNYPNPFNPVTTLQYDLPGAAVVTIIIYTIHGGEVARLIEGYMAPGYHQTKWNGRDKSGREVPSGIYIARLVTPEYSQAIKMVLLK